MSFLLASRVKLWASRMQSPPIDEAQTLTTEEEADEYTGRCSPPLDTPVPPTETPMDATKSMEEATPEINGAGSTQRAPLPVVVADDTDRYTGTGRKRGRDTDRTDNLRGGDGNCPSGGVVPARRTAALRKGDDTPRFLAKLEDLSKAKGMRLVDKIVAHHKAPKAPPTATTKTAKTKTGKGAKKVTTATDLCWSPGDVLRARPPMEGDRPIGGGADEQWIYHIPRYFALSRQEALKAPASVSKIVASTLSFIQEHELRSVDDMNEEAHLFLAVKPQLTGLSGVEKGSKSGKKKTSKESSGNGTAKVEIVGLVVVVELTSAQRMAGPPTLENFNSGSGAATGTESTATGLGTSSDPSLSVLPSELSDVQGIGCICGVQLVWTAPSVRRQSVATALCDVARKHLVYGYECPREHCAFSQPTEDGTQFAIRYTGRSDFLTFW